MLDVGYSQRLSNDESRVIPAKAGIHACVALIEAKDLALGNEIVWSQNR
jgi:hypothetical protein